MKLRILLFGPFAAALGADHVDLSLPDSPPPTAAAALRALGEAAPALRPLLSHARLAVNSRFADPGQVVAASDELALIGLVSGG